MSNRIDEYVQTVETHGRGLSTSRVQHFLAEFWFVASMGSHERKENSLSIRQQSERLRQSIRLRREKILG